MMETVTIVGTCGCCEREVAIRDGTLVHHGYKRPGDGRIAGDCFGVGYAAYERSTQASINYKAACDRAAARWTETIARYARGEVIVIQKPTFSRHGDRYIVFVVGVTAPERFRSALDSEIRECKLEKNHAEFESARMDRLIGAWKLEELGTETRRGAAERMAAAQRKADREARAEIKRAQRQERLARKASREEKERDLKTRYLGELEALAEKAEATDTLANLETTFEAKQIIERMKREMKRVPRVRFYVRDLKQDALFIRLGLARKDRAGYVSFDFRLDD